MIKCKKIFMAVLFTLFFATSCSANQNEENIYYAPCQAEDSAFIDQTIYFLLNNILYKFNEEKLCLDPACSADLCVYSEHKNSISINDDYEKSENVCTAAILPGGSVIGNNGSDLLAVNNNLYLEINKINPVSLEQELLIETNASSSSVFFPCFANDYCYYAINPQPSETEIRICKIPLYTKITREDSYDAEIVWMRKTESQGFLNICQLDAYEPYVIFTTESLENEVYNTQLYVYDEKTDCMVVDGMEGIIYAGYNEGCIVYMNEEAQVEIFDIKKQQSISQFPLDIYEKGYTIGCDKDYIYINHQGAYIESMDDSRSEKSFFVMDIYDYNGNLVQTVDLSKTVEHSMCAQYLCSTDKYIFIGEASYPSCRGLYMIEKEPLKKGKIVNIVELYER